MDEIIEVKAAKASKSVGYKNRLEGPIFPFVTEAVIKSIKNKTRLYVWYAGDSEVLPGPRWVECYVYGLNKFTKNHCVRVWVYKGITKTEIPQWKSLRMDRIRRVAVTNSKITKAPLNYNTSGDRLFSIIFNSAVFPKSSFS
jgi:hypothetical protein